MYIIPHSIPCKPWYKIPYYVQCYLIPYSLQFKSGLQYTVIQYINILYRIPSYCRFPPTSMGSLKNSLKALLLAEIWYYAVINSCAFMCNTGNTVFVYLIIRYPPYTTCWWARSTAFIVSMCVVAKSTSDCWGQMST